MFLLAAGVAENSLVDPIQTPFEPAFRQSLTEEEKAWLRDHAVIRVAQAPDWPPVEFADPSGEPSGMSEDYLKLIEQRLGLTFERVRGLSWKEAYDRLKRWDVDMTTSLARTSDRDRFLAFTLPYMEIPIVIFTDIRVPHIAGLKELVGKKVAVAKDYVAGEWISNDFPGIRLIWVENAQEGLEKILRNEVFAYVGDILVGGYLLTKLKMTTLKVAGSTPYVNVQRMAVRKDWDVLAGILDKALDSISQTERDDIYRKWMPVRYEYGFDSSPVLWGLPVLALILLGVALWNRKLARHITERKKAEERLEASERRFRKLFQAAPIPLIIAGKTGVVKDINDRWLCTIGYSREDIPTIHAWWERACPDPDEKRRMVDFWESISGGDAETGVQILSSEYCRVTCKAGDIRAMVISATLLGDDMLTAYFDITERLELEAEQRRLLDKTERSRRALLSTLEDQQEKEAVLRKSQESQLETNRQLRESRTAALNILEDLNEEIRVRKQRESELLKVTAAIEQAGEMVLITDDAGTIQYVNPAFEAGTGYSREEVVGRNPNLLKSGTQDQAFYRHLWTTISEGRVWKGRLVNRRKDGSSFIEATTISPVLDKSGRITSYVAVKRDITRQVELNEQLRQAQKMEAVARLTGGIAHDFNNILTSMIGNVDLILEDWPEEDSLREQIMDIREAGNRGAALIRRLLTYSRKQIYQPEIVNLNDIIRSMNKMLSSIIGRNIERILKLAPDLGMVEIDAGQFEQVIMNLAVNARDAMPGGGKLIFETANVDMNNDSIQTSIATSPGSCVMFSVGDTGVGMTPEVKNRIFDPFFTTKEKGKGTGLGLSTVYGIIKQSNGDIQVDSKPGKGSLFKIYFPRVDKTPAGETTAETGKNVRGGTETVLVVEDDSMVRGLAVRILKSYGYGVLEAGHGEEALETSRTYEGPIHLMLTDVLMPGMSGSVLAENLQALRPEIKVLYMSGFSDCPVFDQRVSDKEITCILKPFTAKGLAEKVREILGD